MEVTQDVDSPPRTSSPNAEQSVEGNVYFLFGHKSKFCPHNIYTHKNIHTHWLELHNTLPLTHTMDAYMYTGSHWLTFLSPTWSRQSLLHTARGHLHSNLKDEEAGKKKKCGGKVEGESISVRHDFKNDRYPLRKEQTADSFFPL